jgi:hypothetical protein
VTGLPNSPTFTRREYAIKVAATVIPRAYAMTRDWQPNEGEKPAEFAERCFEFIATVVINSFQGVMDGALDNLAKVEPTITLEITH